MLPLSLAELKQHVWGEALGGHWAPTLTRPFLRNLGESPEWRNNFTPQRLGGDRKYIFIWEWNWKSRANVFFTILKTKMSLFVSLSASSSTTLRHLRGELFRRLPPVRLQAPLAQWTAHFHQSYHCFHSRTSKDSLPGQRPPSSHAISLNYNQCLVYVIIFRTCSAMYAASKPTEITVLLLWPEPDLVISAPSSRVSVKVSENKRLLVD